MNKILDYRNIPLDIISEINETDVKIIRELEEEYRKDMVERYPGEGVHLTIQELSERFNLDNSTVSERVTHLEDIDGYEVIEKSKVGREVRCKISDDWVVHNGSSIRDSENLSVKNSEEGE